MTATRKKRSESLEDLKREKSEALRDSFVEKELIQASIIQRELVKGVRELNDNLKTLDSTLNMIREHEFVEIHKSRWKILAYQILWGIMFAVGTVMGFLMLSWMTYTFFKDSEILKTFIDNQLKMRQFDLKGIREKAMETVRPGGGDGSGETEPEAGTPASGTGGYPS